MDNNLEPYDGNDREKEAFFREFASMRPDLIYSEGWSEGERDQAIEMLRPTKVKTGLLSSIPMRCYGEECAFAPSCPLLKENLHPEGDPCPIEAAAVHQFFSDYVEELEVDVTRMVEVSMVRDLVDQEIQQMRKTWLLSQEHFIQENVAGVDSEGNVVTKSELHQAIDYEERILKRKEKLRNALLATRESKAKAHQGTQDKATLIAETMEALRRQEREQQQQKMIELGLEDYDEYIDAEVVEEDDEDEEKDGNE